MKLSTRVLYAVRIMLDIAQQDGLTPLKYTAERQGISGKYCEQIIANLRAAGLVKSVRGTHGGYLLGRPANEISVGDVVRTVDDPYEPSDDPRDEPIVQVFGQVQTAMFETLDVLMLEEVTG